MTDRQLRCFLALYETLNFSVAARQLFLTQPTLSYQIRTLEEELGTPLFVRTTCRVEPTQAGPAVCRVCPEHPQRLRGFSGCSCGRAAPAGKAGAAGTRHHGRTRPALSRPAAGSEPGAAGLPIWKSSPTPPSARRRKYCKAAWMRWCSCLLSRWAVPVDVMSLFDTRCYLLASPNNPLSAGKFLTPPQLTGQTVCFESCLMPFLSPSFAAAWRKCLCAG